ncbi:MAG: hypothetical protein HMLKMBBP_03435 [Planctomycetes bacterium]|nr:hypothetical protein [Planctomycetota bacterium]
MKRLTAVPACVAVFLAAAPALAGDEYGVSAFSGGYQEPPGGAVVQIASGQDDALREVTLPFEFPFFARLHTRITVSSNGWLAFGSAPSGAAGVSSNPALPSDALPNGIVAALWDDLSTGAAGSVKTFTLGSAPARTFVVAWHHVDTFSGATDDDLSFQVLLHEDTGIVELAYAADGVWDGLSFTAGIEDPSGTIAFGGPGLGNANVGRPADDARFTPRRVTYSGTLLRDVPAADASGLGNSTVSGLPVPGTDVRAVREDTGETAARGRTAADGSFTVEVFGADAPATFGLDVLSSGAEGRAIGGGGTVYSNRFASSLPASDAAGVDATFGSAVDATDASIRRALNVWLAARSVLVLAADHAAAAVSGTATPAETIPPLDLVWTAGAAAQLGATGYVPAAGTTAASVQVHDGADNPDPWDPDVIGREAAQHVLASISVHPGRIAPRSFTTATTAPFAWADGFATWYVCAAKGDARFFDTKSATAADVLDLEATPAGAARGPSVTGSVAATLWDLSDTDATEPVDEVSGTSGAAPSDQARIFAVVDLAMDALPQGVSAFDVGRFLDAYHADAAAPADDVIARIAIANGARADDAFEANDRDGEATVSAAQRIDALVLTPFNEDRFRFTPALDGTQPLSTVVTQTGTTDFDVEVSLVGGGVVATGTNVGAATKSRVTAATGGPAAPGTYEVRVIWRAGAAASYSVAAFDPLRLARTSLPDWTAGEPFKEDLAAAGGVAPYTFSTAASIPGLSVLESGTRLSGTPTTAGDFVVSVSVADAAGTGASAAADVPLRVNERPTIPAILAADAGAPVDAEVGRGGTGTSWTPGTLPPAGFSLTGGASLALFGPAGPARAFDVSGSAADAVGATLGDTTCSVVLCDPLPGTGADVAAGALFGYAFDGITGAEVRLRFRFRGTGPTPGVAAVLDESGRALDLGGAVTRDGRTVRVDRLVLPRTGRWFVVFEQEDGGFAGTVSSRGRAVAPREAHGIVVIDPADEVVPVDLPLEAGSSVRIVLRAAQVPVPVLPQLFGLLDPQGGDLPVPPRTWRRGGRVVMYDAFEAGATGTHVLRIAGDAERTGPVFWQARIRPPR